MRVNENDLDKEAAVKDQEQKSLKVQVGRVVSFEVGWAKTGEFWSLALSILGMVVSALGAGIVLLLAF